MDYKVHKNIEPIVIDNELLTKIIEEQGPKGEEAWIIKKEGRPITSIQSLRLEYLNILRIDHLWMLTGLTKLSLSNNIIEKIQNLDQLVNLMELDLSFNKIEIIENLDSLSKLEVLSLYSNLISKIDNMNTLKNLCVFSIGKNNITEKENILYLRKFKKLKSLNVAGNPCSEETHFRLFVITFLPQISYYEYIRINLNEKSAGAEIFSEQLKQVIENEKPEIEKQIREEQEKIEAELHSESFVEFLSGDELFNSLFESDIEGKLFIAIKEIEEHYLEYKTNFTEITRKLFEMGQEQYIKRKNEVEDFSLYVNSVKSENLEKSKLEMGTFLTAKNEMFSKIKTMQEKLGSNDDKQINDYGEKMQEFYETYNNNIHQLWKQMMSLELLLYEQLEEVNLSFERNMTEMVDHFIEEAQASFTKLRSIELSYLEQINETLNKAANSQDDWYGYPEELKHIIEDAEILNNAVAASHDIHMQLIDGREDRLVNRAKEWLNNTASNLQKNEVQRNRSKIIEIAHYVDIQREDFDAIHAIPFDTLLNPDVSAALN